MDNTNIIIKPLVTEKSTHQQETRNVYAFRVASKANKHQIRRAVEQIYNVKVADVRTMNRKGKPRRARVTMSKTSDWKRAIVTLEENSRIELYQERPMPIKFYNPTSPGRRAGSVLDYKAVLTKFKPEASLSVGRIRANGRNHHGVITAKHRGGGNKRLYRIIDFKRNGKDGQVATVMAIEYDPNRSVHIALIQYEDGVKSYILWPNGLKVGAKIVSGPDSPPEIGNCMPLANVPTGLEIHNIEMNPGQGGKLVRSAGGVGRLGAREGEWAVIILPSGEMRRVRSACRATIGQLGNLDWINVSIGKAGRSRHMGIRPHTRAKAMNPIDHPLGGGEGRSNGGRHPVSKTGVPSKGGITRSPRKNSEKLILRRRKFGTHQQRPQTVNL